jgi:hypothetical protein
MTVIALIGLVALAAGALTLARVRSRSDRQSVDSFDPARVEREVYDHLYGPRPASRPAPAPPANQTPQAARRRRRKLSTERPATGRAAH